MEPWEENLGNAHERIRRRAGAGHTPGRDLPQGSDQEDAIPQEERDRNHETLIDRRSHRRHSRQREVRQLQKRHQSRHPLRQRRHGWWNRKRRHRMPRIGLLDHAAVGDLPGSRFTTRGDLDLAGAAACAFCDRRPPESPNTRAQPAHDQPQPQQGCDRSDERVGRFQFQDSSRAKSSSQSPVPRFQNEGRRFGNWDLASGNSHLKAGCPHPARAKRSSQPPVPRFQNEGRCFGNWDLASGNSHLKAGCPHPARAKRSSQSPVPRFQSDWQLVTGNWLLSSPLTSPPAWR